MRNNTDPIFRQALKRILLAVALLAAGRGATSQAAEAPVGIIELPNSFTLTNGYVEARIEKRSGVLSSLKYGGVEMLAQKQSGAEGGYWSSVGRGAPAASEARRFELTRRTTAGNGRRFRAACLTTSKVRMEALTPTIATIWDGATTEFMFMPCWNTVPAIRASAWARRDIV